MRFPNMVDAVERMRAGADTATAEKLAYDAREWDRINALMARGAVFVFGSNTAGKHGGGAALTALQFYGAKWGKGIGPSGRSYAIPTKSAGFKTLPLGMIESFVTDFRKYAEEHPEHLFAVTRIGCGLAGLTDEQMAPMFARMPENVHLPEGWRT